MLATLLRVGAVRLVRTALIAPHLRTPLPTSSIRHMHADQVNSAVQRPAERAIIGAAIQMELITSEQLGEKGKTLRGVNNGAQSRNAAAQRGQANDDGSSGVARLLLFNLVVLAGSGWSVLRVLRSL